MRIFIENRPKFTINIIILIISLIQGIGLFFAGCSYEGVCQFVQTGLPEPSVCGPLFLIWVVVCALYLTKIVKSPILSTIVAAVFVYFGTMTIISYHPFGLNWPTSVHVLEAYIGYVYFIESIVSKYKLR